MFQYTKGLVCALTHSYICGCRNRGRPCQNTSNQLNLTPVTVFNVTERMLVKGFFSYFHISAKTYTVNRVITIRIISLIILELKLNNEYKLKLKYGL